MEISNMASMVFALAALVGHVQGQCAVSSYYSTTTRNAFNSQTGTTLTNTIHNLIDGHTVIPYTSTATDTWDALKDTDASNGNPSSTQIRLIYGDRLVNQDLTNGDGNTGELIWNREHTWPQSFGVDSSGPDTSDLHALRACDSNVNSARSNIPFDWCTDSACTIPAHAEAASDTGKTQERFMPPARFRGDIARGLFYMAARYDGSDSNTINLMLSDCPNAAQGRMGYLTTLLRWHQEDPPSSEEIARNDIVCGYQGNRNPFIDFPELVARVYNSYSDPGGSSCAPTAPAPSGGSNPTPFPTSFPTTATPGGGGGGGSLSPGDLAIVGFNSDNADAFALLATVDISSGTTIYITDNAWSGSSFSTTEGTLSFTLGSTSAGDIIQGPSGWSGVSGSFALSTTSDTLLVFTGSVDNPSFIAGATYSPDGWASSSSQLPSDLTVGSTAVTLPHADNYKYSGSGSGTRTTVLRNINTYSSARWDSSSSTRFSFNDFDFFSPGLAAPVVQSPSQLPLIAGISAGFFLVAFIGFTVFRRYRNGKGDIIEARESSLSVTNPKFESVTLEP